MRKKPTVPRFIAIGVIQTAIEKPDIESATEVARQMAEAGGCTAVVVRLMPWDAVQPSWEAALVSISQVRRITPSGEARLRGRIAAARPPSSSQSSLDMHYDPTAPAPIYTGPRRSQG